MTDVIIKNHECYVCENIVNIFNGFFIKKYFYCNSCHDAYKQLHGIDSCTQCGGAGEMPVPKTYMTCPCCRGREKFRPCKKCNGKGIAGDEK